MMSDLVGTCQIALAKHTLSYFRNSLIIRPYRKPGAGGDGLRGHGRRPSDMPGRSWATPEKFVPGDPCDGTQQARIGQYTTLEHIFQIPP